MIDPTLQLCEGVITKKSRRLSTLDEWRHYAPPKDKIKHWKDGRSAKENARFWLNAAPYLPSEINEILHSCTDVGTLRTWCAEPEAKIPFDNFSEPANIDLLLTSEDETGPLVVGIEAKADEPFSNTVKKTRCDAKLRLEKKPQSKGVERINILAKKFGLSLERQEVLNLRYQLFTLTAAILAEARRREIQRAIVIVHEFVTPLTADGKRAQNASDLYSFLRVVFGEQSFSSNGMIAGPIQSNGIKKLYFGKAQTTVHIKP